jgi:hypothetical protein
MAQGASQPRCSGMVPGRDDLDLGVAREPAGRVRPRGTQPSLNHDAQLYPAGRRHESSESTFQTVNEIIATGLAEDTMVALTATGQ